MTWKTSLVPILVLASGLCAATPALSADFYAGKTLTLLVPYDPGGSTDANWRMLAPFLARHLPGKPEVIIQNMSGGSGNTGANFVYERARKDGLTILAAPWNAIGALTGAPGMRFDYAKMRFLGGFPDTLMTFARKGVIEGVVAGPEDIVKARRIVLAGLRPDSTMDLSARLSLSLLGVDVKYVSGYRGGAQRTQAVLSGEADATGIGYVGYKTTVESAGAGKLFGLYYHSLKPSPSIKDLMDFPSFYQKVKGKPPEGPDWVLLRSVYLAIGVFLQSMWAPPGTPEEAIQALRAGYRGLMGDAAFQEMAVKTFGGPVDFATIEEGEAVVRELLAKPDPVLVKRLKEYIAAGSN